MTKINSPTFWVAGILLALYLTAIGFRPLLPIDETRYMTVAWEMHLQNGWLAPLTLNFEPYHHKPPVLFWLINLFWAIFGINRWAGLIPITIMSFLVVMLTERLGKKILPENSYDSGRLTFLICGSIPFLIYSTLVMFDLSLTAFVLATFLFLINYAHQRKLIYIIGMGLCMGLAVLTKGPVAYLYILFPVLLGPIWIKDFKNPTSWYAGFLLSFLISVLCAAVWIVPVLFQSDNNFAFWLLWEQTAGRVTGSFGDAHVRPFFFYLPIAVVLFTPWIFFRDFWQQFTSADKDNSAYRFVACWTLPVFLSFCFISGKQPHYLLPLLPGVIIFIAERLKNVPVNKTRNIVLFSIIILISGQSLATKTVFKNYNLQPIADYVRLHSDRPWAWVRNYHGELGFLAKLEQPVEDRSREDIQAWFNKNPNGMALIRYNEESEITKYHKLASYPYRGKNLGIFEKRHSPK
ncbi:MAG: hypothetical protein DI551_03080 [Micavibrio aeruginosavorus]|uniref:Glycosyltransferase RgtA/B/C/D-like domain-containing protein n=1 Tax=Micavibrio aeruginosavorus TaxID=349221 RepID=A0A2W5PSG6_9BACT|nr:MAG: hypothetical protein DI551_03080 [Micavibrio aeruginosavorus]